MISTAIGLRVWLRGPCFRLLDVLANRRRVDSSENRPIGAGRDSAWSVIRVRPIPQRGHATKKEFAWIPPRSARPRLSRRRALSLAAGAAALAVAYTCPPIGGPGHPHCLPIAAAVAAGTPVAGPAAAAPLPMPSTLAADASPEFRSWLRHWWRRCSGTRCPARPSACWPAIGRSTPRFGLASLSSLARSRRKPSSRSARSPRPTPPPPSGV